MTKPLRLVSRAELARRLTVNRSYTYAQCEPGGRLEPAMVGVQINLDHPSAYQFCHEYGYTEPDAKKIAQAARPKKMTPPAPRDHTLPPDDLEALAHDGDASADDWLQMPLIEIVTRFGTQSQFKEYVAAAKTLIGMRGLEEEQARKRGEYMHRSHAEKIVDMIDTLAKMLLNDSITNMASTTEALVKSGGTKKEIEESMRSVISRVIKSAKSQTARALRNG